MRKLALLASVLGCFVLFATFASAQQADAMLGFGTIMSPGASPCNFSLSTGFLTCPEKGGLYPSISADVIFHKRIGFNFEASWKARQGSYGGTYGQPFRPILFDFNGVYQPRLGKKAGLDLMGGIGWQSTRFYGFSASSNCVYFGACYNSSNHFLMHVGGGIRYYVWGHMFLRPEAHYYFVNNNTADFTSGSILRVGASIGYTIGPE